VVDYPGRYVNRVAIANSRIKKVDEKEVVFSWKDYRTGKQHVTPLKGNSSAQASKVLKFRQQFPQKSNPNVLKFLYAVKSAPAP
jgi:hypothetical protein